MPLPPPPCRLGGAGLGRGARGGTGLWGAVGGEQPRAAAWPVTPRPPNPSHAPAHPNHAPYPQAVPDAQSAAPFFDALAAKPYAGSVILAPHLYPPSISKQDTRWRGGRARRPLVVVVVGALPRGLLP